MKAEINAYVWNFISQMLEFLAAIQLLNELNKRLDITLQFKFEIVNKFKCLAAYVCIQIFLTQLNRNLEREIQMSDGAHQIILLFH